VFFFPITTSADSGPTKQSAWVYSLLEGSELMDGCPVCGRPTIQIPLRGKFRLTLEEENPLFATYAISDIEFFGGGNSGLDYVVTGHGTFRIGGEVALIQNMFLTLRISNGSAVTEAQMESQNAIVERLWPMLRLDLTQTNGTLLQLFNLSIAAAPLREIWFSTASSFHSNIIKPPAGSFSGGDLLSSRGSAVRRQRQLTERLGITPATLDLGLDAVDVLPGGEIAFSLDQPIFTDHVGQVQEGDLVSDQGRVLLTYQALLEEFGIMPPVPDLGLDAVRVVSLRNGVPDEVWFSIERDAFSERLGRQLRRGDILSNRGQIIRSNAELLSRFKLLDAVADLGLDALYVWPSGEIWFSTEVGFVNTLGQTYMSGDLLSDQGYVVFRNLELLKPFAPAEDLADFGLDALWVVTDAIPPAPAPRLLSITPDRRNGSVRLRWDGAGQVFQLESAAQIDGPYLPLSPIIPDLQFDHLETLKVNPTQFYRVRQW
jgi:hypothetical protein